MSHPSSHLREEVEALRKEIEALRASQTAQPSVEGSPVAVEETDLWIKRQYAGGNVTIQHKIGSPSEPRTDLPPGCCVDDFGIVREIATGRDWEKARKRSPAERKARSQAHQDAQQKLVDDEFASWCAGSPPAPGGRKTYKSPTGMIVGLVSGKPAYSAQGVPIAERHSVAGGGDIQGTLRWVGWPTEPIPDMADEQRLIAAPTGPRKPGTVRLTLASAWLAPYAYYLAPTPKGCWHEVPEILTEQGLPPGGVDLDAPTEPDTN